MAPEKTAKPLTVFLDASIPGSVAFHLGDLKGVAPRWVTAWGVASCAERARYERDSSAFFSATRQEARIMRRFFDLMGDINIFGSTQRHSYPSIPNTKPFAMADYDLLSYMVRVAEARYPMGSYVFYSSDHRFFSRPPMPSHPFLSTFRRKFGIGFIRNDDLNPDVVAQDIRHAIENLLKTSCRCL